MPTRLVPLFVASPAFTTTDAFIKLPFYPTGVLNTWLYWSALAPLDGADLWTQNGNVALGPLAAGSYKLFSFTMPASGNKASQRDRETFCAPLPSNHNHLFLRLRNASASAHNVESETLFSF